MSEFEELLTKKMGRVDAPKDFAARVMARAEGKVVAMPNPGLAKVLMTRPKAWWGGAIAAVLVLGVLGGEHVHKERAAKQEMEAKRVQAEREFDTATRITDETMERMREKLAKRGVSIGE
jgi:hypothetical protein